MSAAPRGWESVALAEVVRLKTGPFGSALHKSDYVTGGVPLINPSHIREGRLEPDPNVSVDESARLRLGDYLLQQNDVVMGRRGEMGRCAVVPADSAGWLCGTGSVIVRPTSAIDARFLQRFLSSPSAVVKLNGDSVGSTMVNLNQGVLLGLPIELPPLPEQQRIADKLDTVLARVDACRDRLARVAPLLKRFRQSVLAAATSGRLTSDLELPFDSAAESLASLGAVSGGLTKNAKRDELPMRRPYLRVANVHANQLRLGDVTDIGLTEAEFAKTRLVEGDLLIVEGNGSIEQIGRVAMWSGEIADCCHQNHLIRWRAGARVLPTFVLCFLLSPEGRRQIEAVASSTTGLHTLSVSKVGELQLPVPSINLQEEIVRRVETLFAFADRLEARLAQAQTAVDRLTPSLLAKAFRGELVPQDPADEPAAELLKRLAAQRAAAPPNARTTRRSQAA